MVLAIRLLRREDSRCFLIRSLAEPQSDGAIRSWRARLMEGLRGHSDAGARAVLDIYETTMVHHREAALEQIREASMLLVVQPDDRQSLEGSRALGEWWGPLASLARLDNEALRERRYLDHFERGLELHRWVRRLEAL